MSTIEERIQKAAEDLRQAKMMLYDAQHAMQHIAYDCRKMSIAEAYKLGLIRFNFPVNKDFEKAINQD